MERDMKSPDALHSEVRVRSSYFGVRVGAEQSHEMIGVVAASWRRTRICNCLKPIPKVGLIRQSQHKLTLPLLANDTRMSISSKTPPTERAPKSAAGSRAG